jgi:hypothetical protein
MLASVASVTKGSYIQQLASLQPDCSYRVSYEEFSFSTFYLWIIMIFHF